MSHDALNPIIVECTLALFRHYEVELEAVEAAEPSDIWEEDLVLAGIIGFTSADLRGSLVLAMGKSPLARVEAEEAQHRDWIQELSNQLLGRVKNRLLCFGISLHMTTPLSLRGLHLVLEPAGAGSAPLLFRTPVGGALCVMFDGELRPGLDLQAVEGQDAICPDEGSLLLF